MIKINKFAYNYSTFELHPKLISKIVELTGCETYLELGVLQGKNIEGVRRYCRNCIGVDVEDKLVFRDFDFHKKTTDKFFETFTGMADIIFIDADHSFEQVKKDFKNSLKHLNEHGIIILHDTDPFEEKYLESTYCGDSYKMHDWIKSEYPELDLITLPIGVAGLTLISRNKDRRHLKFIK